MGPVASCDVIIPWRTDNGPRQEIFDWVLSRWKAHYESFGVIVSDTGDEVFSRGASRNQGVRDSDADIVILADADTTPVGYGLLESYINVIKDDCWYVAYPEGHYYNLTREFTHKTLQNPPEAVLLAQVHEVANTNCLIRPQIVNRSGSCVERVHVLDFRVLLLVRSKL